MPKIGNATEDAYRRLRHQILNGEFSARQRLIEADLVDSLGLPRMAVRQALARLEHDGLLEKQAGRSSIVRQVSLEELEEIIDSRAALESLSMRRAAERGSSRGYEEINRLLANLQSSATELDITSFVESQSALHNALLELSGLQVVPRLIHSLAALSAQTRFRTALLPNRMTESVDEHRAIVEAVVAGDPDAAEVAVRVHLSHVREAIHRSMNSTTLASATS